MTLGSEKISLIFLGISAFLAGMTGLIGEYGFLMRFFVVTGVVFGILVGLVRMMLGGEREFKRVLVVLCSGAVFISIAVVAFGGSSFAIFTAVLLVIIEAANIIPWRKSELFRGIFAGGTAGLLFGIVFGSFPDVPPVVVFFACFLFALAIWYLFEYALRDTNLGRRLFKPQAEKQEKTKKKGRIRENAEVILSAVIIAVLIRIFIVDNYEIPTGSMIPNLLEGDRLFVTKYVYIRCRKKSKK